MAPRTPPGQLDIPLVWENEPGGDRRSAGGEEAPEPASPSVFFATIRLWLATLADVVIVVAGVGAFLALALVLGAEMSPGQIALAAVAGATAVTVVALGGVWGWRATPGMLLLGVCFSHAIPFGRACRLWAAWLACLLLAGLPLIVRRGGECTAERLAGGALSYRSRPEAA